MNCIIIRDNPSIVSKIHVDDMKVGEFEIYFLLEPDDRFVKLENELYIPHGKLRRINFGSVPCKLIKIVMKKGSPIIDLSKFS